MFVTSCLFHFLSASSIHLPAFTIELALPSLHLLSVVAVVQYCPTLPSSIIAMQKQVA